MGDGATFAHLYMDVNTKCQQPRPANARGYCYTFTYYKDTSPAGVSWAGVYWVFPANNWGTRRGHAMDTTKFHQLRYSASVEFPQPSAGVRGHGPPGREPELFLRKHQRVREPGRHRQHDLPRSIQQVGPYSIPFPDLNRDQPQRLFDWRLRLVGRVPQLGNIPSPLSSSTSTTSSGTPRRLPRRQGRRERPFGEGRSAPLHDSRDARSGPSGPSRGAGVERGREQDSRSRGQPVRVLRRLPVATENRTIAEMRHELSQRLEWLNEPGQPAQHSTRSSCASSPS